MRKRISLDISCAYCTSPPHGYVIWYKHGKMSPSIGWLYHLCIRGPRAPPSNKNKYLIIGYRGRLREKYMPSRIPDIYSHRVPHLQSLACNAPSLWFIMTGWFTDINVTNDYTPWYSLIKEHDSKLLSTVPQYISLSKLTKPVLDELSLQLPPCLVRIHGLPNFQHTLGAKDWFRCATLQQHIIWISWIMTSALG